MLTSNEYEILSDKISGLKSKTVSGFRKEALAAIKEFVRSNILADGLRNSTDQNAVHNPNPKNLSGSDFEKKNRVRVQTADRSLKGQKE